MTRVGAPGSQAHPRRTAWLSGLVLGAIGGFLVFVFPAAGVAVLGLAILLVLWKGPGLAGISGILVGFGLTWGAVFLRVRLTCDATNALPGQSCVAPGVDGYLAAAAGVALIGLVLSVLAATSPLRD